MRILYVDKPFAGTLSGGEKRSRFLASALTRGARADLLLTLPRGAPEESVDAYPGFESLDAIRIAPSLPPRSSAFHRFAGADQRRVGARLREGRYDAVVLRFASQGHLARLAAAALPAARVVVDCDMLLHRLAGFAWQRDRSLHNRFFLLSRIRLRSLESRLFREPFLFLFSNPVECDLARSLGGAGSGRFAVVPNTITALPEAQFPSAADPAGNRVLFFGSSSVTNDDAFRHLVRDVLPGCRDALAASGLRVRVAGRFPSRLVEALRDPLVEAAGEVPDMDAELRAARFVLLPLRVASGTRTRILEAARWAKAVVTTPLGAEGLDLPDGALVIRESAAALASAVSELATGRLDAATIGGTLRAAVLPRYESDRVAAELWSLIESFEAGERAPHSPRGMRR